MIKTRFAPSPTGYLHIGGLRTALFAYLWAKKSGGEFVLRIEDTDRSRFVEGATQQIIDSLSWAGIVPDEGPYFQSERLPIYQEHAKKLINLGVAYYAFDTADELMKMREEQEKAGLPPRYDRDKMKNQYTISDDELQELISNGREYVVRMKIPAGENIVFNDRVRGEVSFNSNEIDDQVILKSDGFPTYHLAVVVDDHLMGITDVIRGEEWLPSTPKHILLYRAFGWDEPKYAHLSLLVNDKKQKLSKREGDVSVEDFIKKGYLPEAIVNFIAFLGWNPGDEREFLTLPEMVSEFSFERVHKSPAVFDVNKLDHINAHYIRDKEILELVDLIKPFSTHDISGLSEPKIIKILTVVRDRLVKLSDFDDLAKVFFQKSQYDPALLQFSKSTREHTIQGITKAYEMLLEDKTDWEDQESLTDVLGSAVHQLGLKNGDVFWPIRVALSGQEKSPSPVELLWVLGRDESLNRIKRAIEMLSS